MTHFSVTLTQIGHKSPTLSAQGQGLHVVYSLKKSNVFLKKAKLSAFGVNFACPNLAPLTKGASFLRTF
jgi:hypothetical protein